MFDVEGITNGIKITRINKIYLETIDENGNIYKQDVSSKYDDKKSVIYYDNETREHVKEYQNGTNPNHIADGTNCLDGVDSTNGAMIFGIAPNSKYYGDQTALDIWTHSNNGKPLSVNLGTPIVITDDLYTILSGRVFYDEIYTPGANNNYFLINEKDYALADIEVELQYSYTDDEGVRHDETVTAFTDSYGQYFFAGVPVIDMGNITTCRVTVKKPLESYFLTTENTSTNSSKTTGTAVQTVTLGGLDSNNEVVYTPGFALSDVGFHYEKLSIGIEIQKDWVTDISSDSARPTDVTLTIQSYYTDSSSNRVNVKDYVFVLNNANRWIVYANELPAYEDFEETKPLKYELVSETYTMRDSGETYTYNAGDTSDLPYNTSFSSDTSRSEVTVMVAKNAPKSGTIQIVKRDSTDHSITIQGVEFTLWEKTAFSEIPIGNESEYREIEGVIYHKVKSGTTNENGVLSFTKLDTNSFFVVESAAKVGYRIDTTVYNFNISDENQFVNQTVYNIPLISLVTVIKQVDRAVNGETVPIALSYADNNEFNNPITQNYDVDIVSGTTSYAVCTARIPSGSFVKVAENSSSYTLNSENSSVYNTTKETTVKQSYSNNELFQTSDGDNYTVTLYNSTTLYSLTMTIKKVDGTSGAPLTGAAFTLYSDMQCNTVIATAATSIDESGNATASFTELDAGTYYLKETMAPSGYILPSDVKKVVILNDGSVTVDGYDVSVSADNFSLTVANSLQIIIPQSGSPVSAMLFMLTGISICIAGLAYIIILRKKGGEHSA